jgi:hypothetical protein
VLRDAGRLLSALDDVLEELAELVATKVLARMSAPTDHYTTRKAGAHVPGKSLAWCLRTLKTIPGARKVGRDWIVSVADFDAWLSQQDSAKCAAPKGSRSHANDVEALAAEALQAGGFRRTR